MTEAFKSTSEITSSKETSNTSEKIKIIQGGMGVAISDWKLSKAVAMAGEKYGEAVLPIVSGTGLPAIMIDRLRKGDRDTKYALEAFNPEIAQKIIKKYTSGLEEGHGQFLKPEVFISGTEDMQTEMAEAGVASAFVEIYLAKKGHHGPVGINLLEKIQLMHLPTILGAMMADVDYVVVGAGVPNQIPKMLSNFENGQKGSYLVDIIGAEKHSITLDPKPFIGERKLKKPKFFPIVSSTVLAKMLAGKVEGVDGFIVEGPLAGGHNAPARGKELNEIGEPVYGEKDKPDLNAIKALGKPFYLAGAYADKLREAQDIGANGIQVGTLFALCNESGMREDIKDELRKRIMAGDLSVFTDPRVSPSGYPFMVAQLEGTLSQRDIYNGRNRSCQYGYLVHPYQKPEGGIGFRCPAEPVDIYVRKGGKAEETHGKGCLCAGLIATAGHASKSEQSIVTLGKVLDPVRELMKNKAGGKYSAEDVVLYIASRGK
jgi:nitronate monooxygenase